jgi:hypothetical protein
MLFGNSAAATFEGTLFAGAVVCCLIPYAVARWTGMGLPGSIAASIAGSSIPAGIAAAFFLYAPIPAADLENYFSWLVYNTDPATHFHYEGRIRLDQCHGLPSHSSYILGIPAEARQQVERQTRQPLRELLQQSIGPHGPLGFSCSFAVTEPPDGSLELRKECEAETGSLDDANKSPGKFRSVQYEVPVLRPRSSAVIPDKASTLVVTAPRGCIADSDPPGVTLSGDSRDEAYRIGVGFPQIGFTPFGANRMLSKPGLVQIRLLKEPLGGVALQMLVRGLLRWEGIVALFVLAAYAMSAFLRGDLRPWRARTRLTLAARMQNKIAAAGRGLFQRISSFSIGFGWMLRSLIVVVLVIILAIVAERFLPTLLDAAFFLLLGPAALPPLRIVEPVFVVTVMLIEILRWAGRRLMIMRARGETALAQP